MAEVFIHGMFSPVVKTEGQIVLIVRETLFAALLSSCAGTEDKEVLGMMALCDLPVQKQDACCVKQQWQEMCLPLCPASQRHLVSHPGKQGTAPDGALVQSSRVLLMFLTNPLGRAGLEAARSNWKHLFQGPRFTAKICRILVI